MTANPLSFFVIPLALALTGLFAAAWIYDLKTFRRRKRKDETIYRCTDCQRIYTHIQRTPLARCPRCGKQNAAVRQR